MENHPLTPMTDPDLRRVLALQSKGSVGHVPAASVFDGAQAVRDRMDAEDAAGHRLLIADAIRDADLMTLGAALDGLPLITGGSGIAMGLPENFRRKDQLSGTASDWPGQAGQAACLSGSCSNATRAQVSGHEGPHMEVTANALVAGEVTPVSAADWAAEQGDALPLIYSSADPEVARAAQATHGKDRIAAAFESFFAETACALVARGATRLITAGGETSGAVVEALGPPMLAIGPEIDPGVPAIRAGDDLVLALKSGNFGAPDFFAKAARVLRGDS
jgi:uncharacterized protein YgbK (DUF1537 family)